ncbi:hypothetical protein ACFSTC_56045 [Nonomuraea ferruginea]
MATMPSSPRTREPIAATEARRRAVLRSLDAPHPLALRTAGAFPSSLVRGGPGAVPPRLTGRGAIAIPTGRGTTAIPSGLTRRGAGTLPIRRA